MAEAVREENNIPVLIGVSSVDPTITITVAVNPVNNAVIVKLA